MATSLADEEHQEGRDAETRSRRMGRGNLWRAEPHERYRHETRPERQREEESVKRLRKPGGAARVGSGKPGVGRFPLLHAL
jgi:hypothetical protein